MKTLRTYQTVNEYCSGVCSPLSVKKKSENEEGESDRELAMNCCVQSNGLSCCCQIDSLDGGLL